MNEPVVAPPQAGGITEVSTAKAMLNDTMNNLAAVFSGQPVAAPQPAQPVEAPAPQPVVQPVTPPVAEPAPPADLRSRFSTTATPPADPLAPVPPPVVPETPPGLDPTKPESKQQVFTWGKLRSEHDQFRKEAAELRQQMVTVAEEKRKLAEDKALVEAERQKAVVERDTYAEKLGKVSLAESPEFQSRYDEKVNVVQQKLAADLLKYTGVKEDEVMQEAYNLLNADPKQLTEAFKDNPQMLGRVMTRVEEAAGLLQQRDVELANWRDTSASLGIKSAQEQVLRSTEARRQWADLAIDIAKQSGHPIFSAVEGDWKKVADEVSQAAHGFVQTATEEELTRAAVEGFANPYLYNAFNQVVEENRQLRDRLEGGYRMATPPLFPYPGEQPRAPGPAPLPPNVTEVKRPENPLETANNAISQALRNLGIG